MEIIKEMEFSKLTLRNFTMFFLFKTFLEDKILTTFTVGEKSKCEEGIKIKHNILSCIIENIIDSYEWFRVEKLHIRYIQSKLYSIAERKKAALPKFTIR